MARILVSGAVSGAITVHGISNSRARQATPCAMFPADAVTTPLRSSSADMCAMALAAPRILNDPMGCRFSSLR